MDKGTFYIAQNAGYSITRVNSVLVAIMEYMKEVYTVLIIGMMIGATIGVSFMALLQINKEED